MHLFNNISDNTKNYLPKDGIVQYYGKILTTSDAELYLNGLLDTIEWRHDELMMFGKKIITKRKVAWYGSEPFAYTYSRTTKRALPWTEELIFLKNLIEVTTQETYNSCLLNLYHNGSEGMAWHSDDEPELKPQGAIASMSLGAARTFAFRHKQNKQKVELALENGSLLLMKDSTQTHWLHALKTTRRVLTPRINLTFRTIIPQTS